METSEIKNISQRPSAAQLTRRGEAAVWGAGIGVVTALAVGTVASADRPDFEGSQTVKLTNDPEQDTLTEIAVNNVDGADNHVKATVDKIVKMNPEVFGNGKQIGHEDLGKKISMPESVE